MNYLLDSLLIRKHRACYLKYISLIYAIDIQTIVEVGVFRGKNAEVLRELFPKAHLYLVDPWTPSEAYLSSGSAVSENTKVYQKAEERVKTLFEDDPQVTLIKKDAETAADLLPSNLDLVFIDANHSYETVKQDILTYLPKMRTGGILSGHNYGRKRIPDVKKAVQECFKDNFLLGQDEVWLHICEEDEKMHRRGLEPPTT